MLNDLTAVKSGPTLCTSALELLFLFLPQLVPHSKNHNPTTNCAALHKEAPCKICLPISESHPICYTKANLRCFIMAMYEKTSSHRVWHSVVWRSYVGLTPQDVLHNTRLQPLCSGAATCSSIKSENEFICPWHALQPRICCSAGTASSNNLQKEMALKVQPTPNLGLYFSSPLLAIRWLLWNIICVFHHAYIYAPRANQRLKIALHSSKKPRCLYKIWSWEFSISTLFTQAIPRLLRFILRQEGGRAALLLMPLIFEKKMQLQLATARALSCLTGLGLQDAISICNVAV